MRRSLSDSGFGKRMTSPPTAATCHVSSMQANRRDIIDMILSTPLRNVTPQWVEALIHCAMHKAGPYLQGDMVGSMFIISAGSHEVEVRTCTPQRSHKPASLYAASTGYLWRLPRHGLRWQTRGHPSAW